MSRGSPRAGERVPLTRRQLTLATLDRQLLLGRADIGVEEAIHQVVALQAQEPASPYVAMWNRVSGFAADDLDRAFRSFAVVKASLMRITLHAVDVRDYPTHRAALESALRASRLNDRRFKESGLATSDADRRIAPLLEFLSEPKPKAEIEAHLAAELGEQPSEWLWWALRTYAPLVHAPSTGSWTFGRQPVFQRAPASPPADPSEAVVDLVTQYLRGFGPATAQDIGQFTLLPMSVIRPALARAGDGVVELAGPDGEALFDAAGSRPIPDDDVEVPARLLGMWDSILLAHRDRTRVISDAVRAEVIRRNGDVLPTVMVDGQIVGVWRIVGDSVEVTPFDSLSEANWAAVESEATALRTWMDDRDPALYQRYDRWWAKLPTSGRRTV